MAWGFPFWPFSLAKTTYILVGLITFLGWTAPVIDAETASGRPERQISDTFSVLPLWLQYLSADEATFAREAADLRKRFGPDSDRVKIGFTTYIFLDFQDWKVDTSNPAAVHAAMAANVAQIDRAIERARQHKIVVGLAFQTAIRSRYDPVQRASELEDRRNMQWYSDNTLAAGWWTYSRYARKQRRVLEAYIRELGRIVANRMAKYPETLVAASGDGEVELAFDKSPVREAKGATPYTLETMQLADYSPFAVAEFRDWLRRGGSYGAGQPYAAEAYEQSARYAGDVSPGTDTNRDGHTLNGDFGTTFTSWDLRHFNWSLATDALKDTGAIPATAYQRPEWNPLPGGVAGGFDPSRKYTPGNAWWEVWHLFRQTMLWRHNREFATWMTTSPDPETGARVPADRWYSDQIAADYLFGHTPERPNVRFITSASSWWTADIAPMGRLGITAFNTAVDGVIHKTLGAVASKVGARDVDWAITEWHPASPVVPDPAVYRDDARLVALFGAGMVVPIFWGGEDQHQIQGTPFETAIRELIETMKKGVPRPEIETSVGRLNFASAPRGPSTPPQTIDVTVLGRGAIAWRARASDPRILLSPASGAGRGTIEVRSAPGVEGDVRGTITIESDAAATPKGPIQVLLRGITTATTAPRGSFDAPGEGATVPAEFDLGGWALDDVGVMKVEAWREPVPGERASANGLVRLGTAAFQLGARPDVAAAFADAPQNERAGWGLRVNLSDVAGGSPRTIKLHVLVTDVEGNLTDLGPRTVTVAGR